MDGNYDAMGMDALVKKVFRDVGIWKERFSLQWASAAKAPRFVQLITEFTEKMKGLGPIGEAEGLSKEEAQERISKALDALSIQKARISFGNATKAVPKDGIDQRTHQ